MAAEYDPIRHQVLVACWHAGTFGLPNRRDGRLTPGRLWRVRCGARAAQVHLTLGKVAELGPEQAPDPPTALAHLERVKIEYNDPDG